MIFALSANRMPGALSWFSQGGLRRLARRPVRPPSPLPIACPPCNLSFALRRTFATLTAMRERFPHLLCAALLLFLLNSTASASQKQPHAPRKPQSLHRAKQSAPALPAQLVTLGESAVPLTGPWKFSPGDSPWEGDSPVWAQSDFDDSGWPTIDITPPSDPFDLTLSHDSAAPGWTLSRDGSVPGWTAKGFPHLAGYAWYRLRIRVVNAGQPLWLKMPARFDNAYQIYANGQLAGQFGSFGASTPVIYWPRPAAFALPPPDPRGDIELALRFYMSPAALAGNSAVGGMHEPPVLGLPVTLGLIVSEQDTRFAFSLFGQILTTLFFLVLAPVVLWLWLQNRRELAFLWLSINLSATVLFDVLNWIALTGWISARTASLWLFVVLGSGWLAGWITLWWYWFDLRKRRWILWTAWLMAGANSIIGLCAWSGTGIFGSLSPVAWQRLNNASLFLVALACMLLLAVLVEGFRRDRVQGLLATPPVLLLEIAALFSYFSVLFNLPYPALKFFGLTIDVSSFASILMALAIGALAIRRFLRTRVQQELARQTIEQDLEQARELQQHVLIPDEIESPDFNAEVRYQPAQIVGGDFFQTILGRDSSLLIIIGDVSGKGISAAMLVSVLVGAARTRANDSFDPASMLAVLNQRLIGRSGGHFATCLVAELQPDGRLRMANAGHISPYLNGAEVPFTGSLPLGLASKVEPSLQALQLRPGDKLTFITDGVVEARDASGELFGFARARIICNEPVNEIVQRAQQFGQNDDITVLRVVYTGGRREMFLGRKD
jgi:hypothetical protein